MVPPTESLRFVAGELGKSGRNLEQIGAKFLGPNRFGVFFKTWRNASLHVHDLGHIGKLEANLDSFKTALRVVLNMIFFVSICDTICVTNRDTSSNHFNHQARACQLFTHR